MSVIVIGSIVGIILVIASLLGTAASRYKKAGPHQALITTGMGGVTISIGGGKFVWPVVQKLFYLDLQARKVSVQRSNIFASNRVAIDVEAVVTYKVKGTVNDVKLAAQAIQETEVQQVDDLVQSVAEGAFRDIVGKMTPEQINEERDVFQNRVIDMAQNLFDKIGFDLISFVVTRIGDEAHYFDSLGKPALAAVKQTARQKEATANKEATITEVESSKDWETRKAETEAQVAEAQKDMNVKKAQYNALVDKENAIAEQAGPKARAEATREVVIQETVLEEKRAERKEKELLVAEIKPADAKRQATILEAEGKKQASILEGEGEGTKKAKIGEGEGQAAKAILVAEAEGLERKAKAMREFTASTQDLEMRLRLIDKLPEIVTAASKPITAIEALKIVHFSGNSASGNGESGSGPLGNLLKISPQTLATTDEIFRSVLGFGLREIGEKVLGQPDGDKDQVSEGNPEVTEPVVSEAIEPVASEPVSPKIPGRPPIWNESAKAESAEVVPIPPSLADSML